MLCVGLTIPAWGPRLGRLGTLVEQHRRRRAIMPLWRALIDAVRVRLPAHASERRLVGGGSHAAGDPAGHRDQ